MMKLLLLLALMASSAHAVIIGTDSFDYADGPLADRNGGQLWNWKNRITAGRSSGPSDWDVSSGTPTISSSRLITQNSAISREYNGPIEDPPTNTDEANGAINNFGTHQERIVYYRITFTTGETVPDSVGIASSDFGTTTTFFGKPATSAFLGIVNSGQSFTGTALQPRTNYTLVTKMDYIAGFARLYINPDLNDVEPTPAASRTIPTNWSTAVRLSSVGGDPVIWDDLVVCTLWTDLADVRVTTLNDEDNGNLTGSVSLREAVKYGRTGARITFAPNLDGGTLLYSPSLPQIILPFRGNVTVDATASSAGITLDANLRRHFYIEPPESLILRGLTLTGGSSGTDGGSILNEGRLILDRCTFVENKSSRHGGAVSSGNASGTNFLRAVHCTFANNTAASDGGGIFIQGTGSRLELHACTLSGNIAGGGGAISQSSLSSSLLTACTVAGNRATGGGFSGGIELFNASTTLRHCTVSQNIGNGAAGGIRSSNVSTLTIGNSIIAGNIDPIGGPADITRNGGTLAASGSNLIGSNASVTDVFSESFLVGTATAPLDPMLSPLGTFGGHGLTLHPLINSRAIDTAGSVNPGGSDARGFPRFQDGDASNSAQLDIGAVEAGPIKRLSIATDDFSLTLRQLLNNNEFPGTAQRIGFDPAVFPASTITLTQGDLLLISGTSFFIDASNLASPVTISGNNAFRLFNIPTGANLALHSLKLLHGKAPDTSAPTDTSPGGGILNAGALSLFDSTVADCRSGSGIDGLEGNGGDGGGIFSSGPLHLHACTLSGNRAGKGSDRFAFRGGRGGSGGAIASSGPFSLTSSTLANNFAGTGGLAENSGPNGDGGALSRRTIIPYRITHSTIVGNSAVTSGGIFSNAPLILRDSIVANNSGSSTTSRDIQSSSIFYGGSNLIGSSPTASSISNDGGTNFFETDPKLVPLANYGGPTHTMLPFPGSAAINSANTSTRTRDQRGLALSGTRDIGAVEADLGSFIDTDADGMDDRLERLYRLTVGLADGAADADGDGSCNAAELGNKTHPRDPTSLLKITAFTRSSDGGLTITWTSFPGLSYTIEVDPTLRPVFRIAIETVTADGMTQTRNLGRFAAPMNFFRIRRN